MITVSKVGSCVFIIYLFVDTKIEATDGGIEVRNVNFRVRSVPRE